VREPEIPQESSSPSDLNESAVEGSELPPPPSTSELESEVKAPTPGRLGPDLAFSNTPLQQGRMIGSGKPAPTASNNWDRPVPTTDTADIKIVKPGQKIRVGGDSV
jgi:hypothetical protein